MSLPNRSATTPSHRPQPAATAPLRKTLDWHKRNFANQQKAWQMKASIEAAPAPSSQRPARLVDKPLPVRRRQTDDRGTLRVVNPDRTPTPDTEHEQPRPASRRRGDVVGGDTAVRGPLSKSHSVGGSIRRKPLGRESRDEVVAANSGSVRPPALPHRRRAPPQKPSPSSSGQTTQDRTRMSRLPSELGNPGMLGVPLSVYGFRGTLPTELQPEEPPLRWDAEPAPQIPPVVSRDSLGLYRDADLVKYMTTDKSDLQSFRGTMPVATTIVKGELQKFVEK
ncbi:hypothetical protein P171DRAFT_442434 [Karstenula rhodostoma CBS 690.94]|uniref:Uncharacterized protein n=1 Tax=Karstenula rhodostoma CBS 690.94 TaxID=1392251 RepID=A0A9P4PNM9_9PLEO|nr:hypothetical protein P171DRAFT_442434 [Karstenula rhodostoma CBS 690.94]